MTTSDNNSTALSAEHIERLTENMGKVEELTKRLVDAMSQKTPHNTALDGPNQELFARAATAYWSKALQNPAHLLEQQIEFWSKSVLNFAEAQQALTAAGEGETTARSKDRRFSNPMWEKNPYFHYI